MVDLPIQWPQHFYPLPWASPRLVSGDGSTIVGSGGWTFFSEPDPKFGIPGQYLPIEISPVVWKGKGDAQILRWPLNLNRLDWGISVDALSKNGAVIYGNHNYSKGMEEPQGSVPVVWIGSRVGEVLPLPSEMTNGLVFACNAEGNVALGRSFYKSYERSSDIVRSEAIIWSNRTVAINLNIGRHWASRRKLPPGAEVDVVPSALSEDGKVVAGDIWLRESYAEMPDWQQYGFVWTDKDGLKIHCGGFGRSIKMTPDGSTLIGWQAGQGFVWDRFRGCRSMETYLQSVGISSKSITDIKLNAGDGCQISPDAREFYLGNYVVRVNEPPVITLQPVGGSYVLGQPFTLSVESLNMSYTHFQWRRNGIPLKGQTNAAFHLDAPRVVDSATYDVLLINKSGITTSKPAKVTFIKSLPIATFINPRNGSVALVGRETIVAIGIDSPDVSIQSVEVIQINDRTSLETRLGNAILTSESALNGIYELSWIPDELGTFTLKALATDVLDGVVSTSSQVVVSQDSRSAYAMSRADLQVNETARYVDIGVTRRIAGEGVVTLRTVRGTQVLGGSTNPAAPFNASGQGHYDSLSNHVVAFDRDKSTATVRIPIADNPVFDGPRYFDVVLESPGNSAQLLQPSQTRVFIMDDELAPPDPLAHRMPPDQWPPMGNLRLVIDPSDSKGEWRFPWSQTWLRSSDDVARNLEIGAWPIEILPRVGAGELVPSPVKVAGGGAQASFRYSAVNAIRSGKLRVDLEYEGGPGPVAGMWRSRSLIHDPAHPSGYVLTNLSPGRHVITFEPIAGFLSPADRVVEILEGEGVTTVVRGTYRLPPLESPLRLVRDLLTQAPASYVGQLVSDTGTGSGLAVRPRVVLTAAHLLFHPGSTNRVRNLRWLFRRQQGEFEPLPLEPSGVYLPEAYLTELQRADGDARRPNVRDHDIAALYFVEDAAKGGYSGYLTAPDSAPQARLVTEGFKTLIGYPLDAPSAVNQGRMHSFSFQTATFDLLPGTTRVFRNAELQGAPGLSGGPLWIDSKGGNGPIGVYLGQDGIGMQPGSALFRALDSVAVSLIDRAERSAYDGENHGGNAGVIQPSASAGCALMPQRLHIRVEPPSAIALGAGWRVHLVGNGVDLPKNGTNGVRVVSCQGYQVDFTQIPGWKEPQAVFHTPVAGQDAEITVRYEPNETARPRIWIDARRITVSGTPGRRVVLEWTQTLQPGESWIERGRAELKTEPIVFGEPLDGPEQSGFYRARWDE